ncbi:MAG: hypothetical protein ABUT20_46065 [Bacteroidota bacterium]
MRLTKKISFPYIFPFLAAVVFAACHKSSVTDNPPDNTPYKVSYGDSIVYLKTQSSDYIVYPTVQKAGTYTGFPEGIEIDASTGAINVSKSETGLRYLITYKSPTGDTSTTKVVLSGITFKDQLYYLSENDTVAMPIYNASVSRVVPLSGSSFDEGNNANSGGCSVKTTDGQINLAQTVRNGVFGTVPTNDAKQEFDILYRLNDQSNKSLNKLRVKVYYYETINDLTPDLIQTLQSRQDDGVFIGLRTTGNSDSTPIPTKALKAAKPRPPCIVVIAKK